MTYLVSWSWSWAFHIWPLLRMAAGMDASMMTSLGTCRLVMPLLLSTCASAGPLSYAAVIAASISSFFGLFARSLRTPPRPWFGSAPTAARSSPYCSQTSAK